MTMRYAHLSPAHLAKQIDELWLHCRESSDDRGWNRSAATTGTPLMAHVNGWRRRAGSSAARACSLPERSEPPTPSLQKCHRRRQRRPELRPMTLQGAPLPPIDNISASLSPNNNNNNNWNGIRSRHRCSSG